MLLVGATPVAEKLETVAPMLSIPLVRFEDGTDPNGLFEVAVVATQGKKDKDGLKQALRYTVGKIYFIASSKKAKKLKEQLIDDGVTESILTVFVRLQVLRFTLKPPMKSRCRSLPV